MSRSKLFTAAASALLVIITWAPAGYSTTVTTTSLQLITSTTDASTTTTTTPTTTTTTPTTTSTTTTIPTPGLSSEIQTENARPGTASWRLAPAVPGSFVEGFANVTDASAGTTVSLYVRTNNPTFTVTAYRMGYYQGLGAREVWRSQAVAASPQPACRFTAGINLVSCDNWHATTSFLVQSTYLTGDYLLKLTSSRGAESYVPLVVTAPQRHATYLVMARPLTEQGWNTYGGYTYYQGLGPCTLGSGSYPPCNRARVVSFDRPYATGRGASDFLGNEYPLVYYMEQHGYDVGYASDVALTLHPEWMLNFQTVLSLGHDETWTNAERVGALRAVARGVNFIFFGSAASVRHSRLEPSALGPARQEVNYRDSSEDPLNGHGNPLEVTGNQWGVPPASWNESSLIGEMYAGYTSGMVTYPFVPIHTSSWLYAHTGLHDGQKIPGVIRSDFDHYMPYGTNPVNLEILGHSPIPTSAAVTSKGSWNGSTYSDVTYWSDPVSKAGVLDFGVVTWIWAMELCTSTVCPAHALQAVTANALHAFGQGPAGRLHPSRNNVATVPPYR